VQDSDETICTTRKLCVPMLRKAESNN